MGLAHFRANSFRVQTKSLVIRKMTFDFMSLSVVARLRSSNCDEAMPCPCFPVETALEELRQPVFAKATPGENLA